MRKHVFAFAIFLSTLLGAPSSAWSASSNPPPAVPTLTVGGQVYTDLTNLIVLQCGADANKYTTCRKPGVGSAYQVTSGKTFTITSIQLFSNNTTSGPWLCAQTDTDVGINSASNGTNPVYLNQNASTVSLPASATAGGSVVINTKWSVSASKYITCANGAGATAVNNWVIYGYEK